MRYFYEMYPDAAICPQVEDKLIIDANRPQVGDDLQIIFRIDYLKQLIKIFILLFSKFQILFKLIGKLNVIFHTSRAALSASILE